MQPKVNWTHFWFTFLMISAWMIFIVFIIVRSNEREEMIRKSQYTIFPDDDEMEKIELY